MWKFINPKTGCQEIIFIASGMIEIILKYVKVIMVDWIPIERFHYP